MQQLSSRPAFSRLSRRPRHRRQHVERPGRDDHERHSTNRPDECRGHQLCKCSSSLSSRLAFTRLSRRLRQNTAIVGNYTVDWIRNVSHDKPFFVMAAPHAPHVGAHGDGGAGVTATPAKWYCGSLPGGAVDPDCKLFADVKAPRRPNCERTALRSVQSCPHPSEKGDSVCRQFQLAGYALAHRSAGADPARRRGRLD